MKKGKGYVKNKMSVNASIAHSENILPLSKWRKATFIEEVEYITDEQVKKVKGGYKKYLKYNEWHHTGYLYNVTKFYKIDENKIAEAIENENIEFYTEEEIKEIERLEKIKEIARQKEIENKKEKEEIETEEILTELKTANIIERKTKKGGIISTIEITEKQPILFSKLKNNNYMPTKEYGKILDIYNIVEFKLV